MRYVANGPFRCASFDLKSGCNLSRGSEALENVRCQAFRVSSAEVLAMDEIYCSHPLHVFMSWAVQRFDLELLRSDLENPLSKGTVA